MTNYTYTSHLYLSQVAEILGKLFGQYSDGLIVQTIIKYLIKFKGQNIYSSSLIKTSKIVKLIRDEYNIKLINKHFIDQIGQKIHNINKYEELLNEYLEDKCQKNELKIYSEILKHYPYYVDYCNNEDGYIEILHRINRDANNAMINSYNKIIKIPCISNIKMNEFMELLNIACYHIEWGSGKQPRVLKNFEQFWSGGHRFDFTNDYIRDKCFRLRQKLLKIIRIKFHKNERKPYSNLNYEPYEYTLKRYNGLGILGHFNNDESSPYSRRIHAASIINHGYLGENPFCNRGFHIKNSCITKNYLQKYLEQNNVRYLKRHSRKELFKLCMSF